MTRRLRVHLHSDFDRLVSVVRPELVEGPSTSLRATGTGHLHRRKVLVVVAVLAGGVLGGCRAPHISTYQPKQRKYELPAGAAQAAAPETSGSLFRPGASGAMLFTDARALRVHDLVVVRVEELADSQRRADTDLRHSSKMQADLAAFLEVAGVRRPEVTGELGGTLSTDFQGLGSTRRTERLMATVPSLVRQVLPNGNLFIEGHRVVLVNQEEHHFYISGVVRPIDIDQQNSVKSSLLADAEVEFTATGNLTDNQRQGWLSRFINWAWPF